MSQNAIIHNRNNSLCFHTRALPLIFCVAVGKHTFCSNRKIWFWNRKEEHQKMVELHDIRTLFSCTVCAIISSSNVLLIAVFSLVGWLIDRLGLSATLGSQLLNSISPTSRQHQSTHQRERVAYRSMIDCDDVYLRLAVSSPSVFWRSTWWDGRIWQERRGK